jgi:hypothetical protein
MVINKITTMTSKQQIRSKLPGYEINDTILCDIRSNGHNKWLRFKYCIKGFMDELIPTQCYWVESYDGVAPICKTFMDLNEAVDYYVSLDEKSSVK